jgi:hypothetical protein
VREPAQRPCGLLSPAPSLQAWQQLPLMQSSCILPMPAHNSYTLTAILSC